jgi:hypothetical protein
MSEDCSAPGSAASEIQALRASVATGADPMQVASLLSSLSSTLATNNHLADATAAQRAAVDVLRAHTPTETELVAHRFALALQLHNLAVRLWAEQRDAEALAAAREAIPAYRQAAATPGTGNILQIASLLSSLSSTLATNNHLADAITAAGESVSIHAVHGDDASHDSALANLTGLYARAPGLRIMRAVLSSTDVELLRSVMVEFRRDIQTEAGIRHGTDGRARVDCYARNDTLDAARARGLAVEVLADDTTVGLTRSDVAVRGNRFADGSVPSGVGLRI